jgi:hypothetical protein
MIHAPGYLAPIFSKNDVIVLAIAASATEGTYIFDSGLVSEYNSIRYREIELQTDLLLLVYDIEIIDSNVPQNKS